MDKPKNFKDTNVKSDIKYHKRHSGDIQFQELTQGSGSTEETSPRTPKSRKYFVCILYEKPEMKIISGEQVSEGTQTRSRKQI